MKPPRSLLPFASFALAALLLAEEPRAQERVAADGLPVLGLSELVLEQYPVQNVDPVELFNLAEELVGREYYVEERPDSSVSGLRLLGRRIVMYDTQEQVKRMREVLARLDAPREASGTSWKPVEYRPRFVSLGTVVKAVEDLVEYSQVPERGLVVLRGDAAEVEDALALLKRIDVPEKQVLLTCQLVEVGVTSQGPPLSAELVQNLQRLLPQSQFGQTGLAMLKTSVGGENKISMSLESPKESYRLDLTPVAFDEGSSSLTIADCKLILLRPDGNDERELFRTNTVLRGGEYTVLAATGSTPRLLVLRVTPQS